MNISIALTLFFMFTLAYLAIVEIFIVMFRLTGLTEDKARFQVVSMLTNSGFTTNESELIASNYKRRKLARMTMLFGYCFTVTIVSMVVNVFLSMSASEYEDFIFAGIYIGFIVILFTTLRKTHRFKMWFDKLIRNIGSKIIFGKETNPILVMDTYGSHVIAQLTVNLLPDILNEKTLFQSGLRSSYDIQILVIKSGDHVQSDIGPTSVIKQGDEIVVFGSLKNIKQLFKSEI